MNEDHRRRDEMRQYARRQPKLSRRAWLGLLAAAIMLGIVLVGYLIYRTAPRPIKTVQSPSTELEYRRIGGPPVKLETSPDVYYAFVSDTNPKMYHLHLKTTTLGRYEELHAFFVNGKWVDGRRVYEHPGIDINMGPYASEKIELTNDQRMMFTIARNNDELFYPPR